VNVNPNALSFTAAGSAYAQAVSIVQSNNTAGFSISTCQSNGATIASAPASTTGSLAVTPVAAGVCTFTVTGIGGHTATIGVTVTTTVVTQQ
jgi:hypothetical protein